MSLSSPVVLDNGSYSLKIGFAGSDVTALKSIPSIVGRPHYRVCFPSAGLEDKVFVGKEADAKRGVLSLSSPLEGGVPTDPDDCQRLWRSAYSLIGARPEAQNVILTEPIFQPIAARQRIAHIFFETFQVPQLFFAPAPILALYPTSNVTGLVVDVGHAHAQAVPIVDGYAISSAAVRSDAAGGAVASEHLQTLLRDDGHTFSTSAELRTVDNIKERLCAMPDSIAVSASETRLARIPPPDAETSRPPSNYTLPDGTEIQISASALSAPAAMLNPAVCGYEAPGVADVALQALARAPLDTRSMLLSSIHLAGGSTLTSYFPEAFRKALREPRLYRESSMKVYSLAERQYSACVGGGILASLSSFRRLWVSAEVCCVRTFVCACASMRMCVLTWVYVFLHPACV